MNLMELISLAQVGILVFSAAAVILLVWRISITLPQEQECLRAELLDLRVRTDEAHQRLETELARVRSLVEQVPPVVVKKLTKVLPLAKREAP